MTPADGLHTLGRWTTDRSLATPHRIAVDDRGCTLSYGELERRAAGLAAGLAAAGYVTGDRIATLTGNSSDHVVVFFACAKAGLGIALASRWMCRAELEAGELVAILSNYQLDGVDLHAVYPGGRRSSLKVRAFSDYLAAQLMHDPALAAR